MNVLARTHDNTRLYIAHSSGLGEQSLPEVETRLALPTAAGLDQARLREAMVRDLRDLRQRPPMVLERHKIPASANRTSLSRLLVVSALLGVSVFGAGTALAMRNGGRLVRASDALAMIPLEKIAAVQQIEIAKEIVEAPQPAAPVSMSAPARVVWTSSNIAMSALEPKPEPQLSEPAAQVAKPSMKITQLQEASSAREAAAVPRPRPPNAAPSKLSKPPGSTLY